jgi:hypothetical protein
MAEKLKSQIVLIEVQTNQSSRELRQWFEAAIAAMLKSDNAEKMVVAQKIHVQQVQGTK